MMKINKIPVALVLLIFSWLIAILGSVFGGYFIVSTLGGNNSLLFGILIMLGGILCAAVTRLLANIGQLTFDLNKNLFYLNQNSTYLNQNLILNVQSFNQDLNNILNLKFQATYTSFQNLNQLLDAQSKEHNARLREVFNELIKIKSDLDLMCCDFKDINQDIHQLRSSFGQTERRPDLKK